MPGERYCPLISGPIFHRECLDCDERPWCDSYDPPRAPPLVEPAPEPQPAVVPVLKDRVYAGVGTQKMQHRLAFRCPPPPLPPIQAPTKQEVSRNMQIIWGFLQDDPNTGNNWFGNLRVKQQFQKQGEQTRSTFYKLKAFAGTSELLTRKNLKKGDFLVAQIEFRNGEPKDANDRTQGYWPDYHQILNVVYAGPYNNEDQQAGGGQAPAQYQQAPSYQQQYGAPQQQYAPAPQPNFAPPAQPGFVPQQQPSFAPQPQQSFQPPAPQQAFNPGSLTPPPQAGWAPQAPQQPQQQQFAPAAPQPAPAPAAAATNAGPAPAWGNGNAPF